MKSEEIKFIRQSVYESLALYETKYHMLGGKGYLNDHFLVDLPIYRNIIIADQLKKALPEGAKVLDFGCGYGDMAYLLKNRRPDVEITGLEIITSEPWRVLTRKIGMEVVIADDELHIPFASESFDSVIAIGSLEHVRNEHVSLQEIHRILRPGGDLHIFLYPNKYSYTEFVQRYIGHPSHKAKKILKELTSLVEGEGFIIIEKKRQFLFPFVLSRFSPLARELYNFFAKPLCILNQGLEQVPLLNIFCNTLSIRARRI